MSVRLSSVELGSGSYLVSAIVLGEVGEEYDCAGQELGRFEERFGPQTEVEDMVARLLSHAAEVYADGYAAWALTNRLAVELDRRQEVPS